MSDQTSQTCPGFFKRPKINAGLQNLFVIFNTKRMANVLEGIIGTNGITINKPTTGEGAGWTISGSSSASPDITAEDTADGGATGSVSVLVSLAVDSTDKHKLLTHSVTLPALPYGFAEGTVITAMQWDASGKKIQIKTATGIIKDESAWTDAITFGPFSD